MEPDFDKICFVIMPFGKLGTLERGQFNDTYENIIKKGVEESGLDLKCVRVDDITKSGSIIDDVILYTARSRFVIADLTGKNANVFYELGIRYARRDRTILLAQCSKDLPFDVQPQRTILYKPTNAVDIDKVRTTLVRFLQEMNHDSFRGDSPVLKVLGAYVLDEGAAGTRVDDAGPGEQSKKLLDSAYDNARRFAEHEKDEEYVVDTAIVPRRLGRPLVSLEQFHKFVNRTTLGFSERFNAFFNIRGSVSLEDGLYVCRAIPDRKYRYYLQMNIDGLCFVRQYLAKEHEPDWKHYEVSPSSVGTCLLLGLMLGVRFLEETSFSGSVSVKSTISNISGTRYCDHTVAKNILGLEEQWTQLLRRRVPQFIRQFLVKMLFLYGEKGDIGKSADSCYNSILSRLRLDPTEGLSLDEETELQVN